MIVKLEQISSTHDQLKDKTFFGYCSTPPTLGDSVVVHYTKGNDSQYVRTTPVEASIKMSSSKWSFHTKNSHYELTEIPTTEFERVFGGK